MGFFGKLFGSDDAIGKTVDVVSKGLDALVYTDEEKATDAAKERSEVRQMLVGWMASTQGQNLARRVISLAITGVWLSQYVLATISASVAVFVTDTPKWNQLSALLRESANEMSSAVMLILAFYFAAPHMGDFAKAVVGKFTSNVNKG